jgi:enoyl-CoA hydratase
LKNILKETESEFLLRALMVTGEGTKAFVAGADIGELQSLDPQQAWVFSQKGQKVFALLEQLPLPTLACIHGFALGGGLELALACDWIYMSDQGRLGLPEAQLSLIPGFGGTARLVERIGLSRAQEMILTGIQLTASQAFQWGIVNQVFPPEILRQESLRSLSRVLSLDPKAVSSAKKLLQRGRQPWLKNQCQAESEVFSSLFQGPQVQKSLKVFLDKKVKKS